MENPQDYAEIMTTGVGSAFLTCKFARLEVVNSKFSGVGSFACCAVVLTGLSGYLVREYATVRGAFIPPKPGVSRNVAFQVIKAMIFSTNRSLGLEVVFVEGDEQIKDPNKRNLQRPRVFYRRETETTPFVVAKP